jgi:hypothetical protein
MVDIRLLWCYTCIKGVRETAPDAHKTLERHTMDMSLEELFAEADAIGVKYESESDYQDWLEKLDLEDEEDTKD